MGLGCGHGLWPIWARWLCPSRANFFLLVFVVIIPELVLPNQPVASVQVSPQLQPLQSQQLQGTELRPSGLSPAPKMF